MALTNYVVCDVSSAPLPNAADYIDKAAIKAPSNYTRPESIAAYVEEEYAHRVAKAGLDIDLAQLTGVALWLSEDDTPMILTGNTTSEHTMLETVAAAVSDGSRLRPIVTYNGHFLDLPLLMRRALYLNVKFPELSIDRFRSSNCDVMLELSYRDTKRTRSLGFYARRLCLGLTKPISGEAESQVPVSGDWDGLRASLDHDIRATRAVAAWAKLVRP